MDMPIPTPSPYSDDSEGSVLRDFVNETIAHEQHSPSPPSGPLSQTSHPGRDSVVDPGPSKRSRQRSYKHTKPHHELVNSDASPDELLRLLMEQKNESHTLRRALRLAAVRVDAEAQRVLAMERAHSQTTEHFRRLNEGRVAAQQDALKANSELRLFQFQFEQAQKEIARGQEMLKMVEDQRDEAEEAAARAKEKARKYLLDRTVAAAREEARREGFEMGFRQVQEEEGFYAAQRRTRQRPNTTTGKRRLGHDERGHNRVNEPATNYDILGDTLDQMSHVSSPTHRLPRDLHSGSPQVIRVEQPPEPVPFSHPEHQSYVEPDPETYVDDSLEPLPVTHPAPDISRPRTPSVQIYSLEIPPAAELERQDSQIDYPDRQPQPWLTAQQHLEMTSQRASSQNTIQSNAGNVDIQNGGTTFSQAAPQDYPGKRKESWYRTLSRRLSRKRKPDPQNGIPAPAQAGSWYTPARPAPPVIVRDYAMPKPQSMADSASISTRMSQLDIVSPPNTTPNGSERSLRAGVRGRRKFKDKDSALFVINEDPTSRVATPVTGDVPRGSMNLGQSQSPRPSSRPPTDADSSYSNPKAVDEWRRSSASFQREMSSHVRPPSGPKRPANLTIPAPLSPENARVPSTPRSRTMSNNTQNSGFVRAQDSIQRLDIPGTPSEISPIGITVEPPSRSPSEALGSARRQDLYLSPNQAKAPSLHSVPSIPVIQNSSAHSSAGSMANGNARGPSMHTGYSSNQRSPLVPQQSRSRPGSTASHGQTQPYPMASKSPSWAPQPLPSDRDRPPSQHWPGERTQRNSLSHNTPKPTTQALPRHMGNDNAGDNISLLSSSHSANHNAPRQSYHNFPSTNAAPWGGTGTARSDGSHRRGVSESHLTPGPSHTDLPPHANGGGGQQTLHRVGSNLSMRSTGSQYAKYDGSKYLDPAYYPPEAVNPTANKGKGVDRRSLNNSIQRPPSAASSNTLSYITDPMS